MPLKNRNSSHSWQKTREIDRVQYCCRPLVILFSLIPRKLPDQTLLPQNSTTTTQMGFSQNDIEIGDLDLVDLPLLDENFEIPDFEEFSSEIEEEENENLTQQQQISNSKLPTRTIPDQIVSPPELVKISQPKQQSVQQKRPTEINSDVDTVSLNMQNVPFYRKEASCIFWEFFSISRG